MLLGIMTVIFILAALFYFLLAFRRRRQSTTYSEDVNVLNRIEDINYFFKHKCDDEKIQEILCRSYLNCIGYEQYFRHVLAGKTNISTQIGSLDEKIKYVLGKVQFLKEDSKKSIYHTVNFQNDEDNYYVIYNNSQIHIGISKKPPPEDNKHIEKQFLTILNNNLTNKSTEYKEKRAILNETGLMLAVLVTTCKNGLLVTNKKDSKEFYVEATYGNWPKQLLNQPLLAFLSVVTAKGQQLNIDTSQQKFGPTILSDFCNDILITPIVLEGKFHGALILANQTIANLKNSHKFSKSSALIADMIANNIGQIWEKNNLNKEIRKGFLSTIKVLVETLEARDPYTRGHSESVARIARGIAKEIGLNEKQSFNVYLAGLLHDIGKIGISEQILNKPSKLTEEEFSQIKKHPLVSREILQGIPEMAALLNIIEQHHERWDGLGYPRNLEGEEIELGARIIAVADSFDAMTSGRVYQRTKSFEEAIDVLLTDKGIQWDPKVVNTFVNWWQKNNENNYINWKLNFTRRIYREILAKVTKEKIILLDKDEIQGNFEIIIWNRWIKVSKPEELSDLRAQLMSWLKINNYPEGKAKDLVLVLSEMATNLLKHGNGGEVGWGLDPSANFYMATVDNGSGFDIAILHKALLVTGFSTKKSLGLGFTVILSKSDSIYLSTDSNGTILLVNFGKA